jgi:disulfide bond formation protein DsbB
MNVLALAGISLSLTVAFYYQLVFGDLPCPLCQLQRVGLIAIGLGFMMNLCLGLRPVHYGVALLGCLLTGIIAARQVMLHILPGDPGFGSTFLGVHFYTWAVLTALATAVFIGGLLLTGEVPIGTRPAAKRLGRGVVWVFIALIAANLVSTVLECGLGPCDPNPTHYQLLGR